MQAAGRGRGGAKPKKKAAPDGGGGDEAAPAAPAAGPPSEGSGGAGGSGAGEGAGEQEARAPSAGPNLREMAFRVLTLCQKGEYPAVDQLLKNIDKLHQTSPLEDGQLPLAGVQDPVSTTFYVFAYFSATR